MSRYDPSKDEEFYTAPEQLNEQEHFVYPEENPLDLVGNYGKKNRKKLGLLQELMGSAARGGTIALSVLFIAAGLTLAAPESYGESGSKLGDIFSRGLKPAINQPRDSVSASGLIGLWNGDVEAPHDYDFDHPVTETQATCTEDGILELVCLKCGLHATEVDPAHGHDPLPPVKEGELKETCTADGWIEEGVYCSVCHEELSRERTVIPAPGHKEAEPVRENETSAACTEDGSCDEVVYCAVCGEELSRKTVEYEALGHDPIAEPVIENVTASTCAKEGSQDEVIYCARCGEELERKTVALPLAEHSPAQEAEVSRVEPTCTGAGSRVLVVKCSVCGEELSRRTETLAALGHGDTRTKTENDVKPTCTADGHYDVAEYCGRCGEELSRRTETVKALGHSAAAAKRENEIKATCTKDGGYDIVSYCSRCGEELSREHFLLVASGHDYKTTVVEPTCIDEGYTEHKCSRCGDTYETDVKEALGHYFEISWNENSPTRCSRCGTNAVTLKYSGDNTFTYTINSGFARQLSEMGITGGELYVLDGSNVWLSASVVSWTPGSSNRGSLYVTIPPGYAGAIPCHLCFMFYSNQQEYMAISPTIRITEYDVSY